MTEGLKLQINNDLPLREAVFVTLRDAILHGTLRPGDRLMEIHLAARLGVSRTPVREAIRMLEQEGLARTLPRRGAVVGQITQSDLQDVLEKSLPEHRCAADLGAGEGGANLCAAAARRRPDSECACR